MTLSWNAVCDSADSLAQISTGVTTCWAQDIVDWVGIFGRQFVDSLTITPGKLVSPSCYLPVILVQHSSLSLSALDRFVGHDGEPGIHNHPIAQPFVIALAMIMFYKLMEGPSQGAISEQNHHLQARFLNGPHEAFSMSIQIGDRGGSCTDCTPMVPRVSMNSPTNNGSRLT